MEATRFNYVCQQVQEIRELLKLTNKISEEAISFSKMYFLKRLF